jgi:hypothetical protein
MVLHSTIFALLSVTKLNCNKTCIDKQNKREEQLKNNIINNLLTLPAHQLVYTVENVEYTKGPLQNSFSDYVKNASLTYI